MANNISNTYIISTKPEEYLQQGLSHCGVYSVKAVLNSRGIDKKFHPKEYHPNYIGRKTGLTLGNKYLTNILSSFGIKSEVKHAQGTQYEKLNSLKRLLREDKPVIVRIGNGYFSNDTYNPYLGKFLGHWISIWGYDDNKKLLYVYDSALPKKFWDKHLPVGNTIRTYQEMIRDWNFGNWQFWVWPFAGKGSFMYIEIKN